MGLQESILICSEADAWKTLENLLGKDSGDAYVEFQGWPHFDLKVEGQRYKSTIPASLLSKLADVQSSLNTFYGQFVYEGDARNLKKFEKHEIELVYKVKEGSTEIRADATGLLNKMGEAMNKPSTQKIAGITLCVLALIVSGAVVISKKSADNRDIEIQKLRILEKAVDKSPELKDASKEFQNILRGIISSASDAKNISVGPMQYNEQKIQELAERSRTRIERIELVGAYRIKSIRRYKSHFLIDIQIDKDTSIRARVRRGDVDKKEIDVLVNSITSNALVDLVIAATKIEDGYANAHVTEIKL